MAGRVFQTLSPHVADSTQRHMVWQFVDAVRDELSDPLTPVLGLGATATARASHYVYHDEADVDALSDAIGAAADFFAP